MKNKYLLLIILIALHHIQESNAETTIEKENMIELQITEPKDKTVTAGRRMTGVYPDTNDYYNNPVCGNKPLKFSTATCYCGNETLSGVGDLANGDSYCCVPPEGECSEDTQDRNSVRCATGTKQLKSKPCYGTCYNSYTSSAYLFRNARLYCKEEDFCLPIQQSCSGVCKTEAKLCSSDVRCTYHGYVNFTEYTVQSLGRKKTKDHDFCLTVDNNGLYDTISRRDEAKVVSKYVKLFEYSDLETCSNVNESEGIRCKEGQDGGCTGNFDWCAGKGDVCTTKAGRISQDNVDLCRNYTFWANRSCDRYLDHELYAIGSKCTADKQHCIFPWYTMKETNPIYSTTCLDKSDQAFPINKTCAEYNSKFLDTYKKLWCGEGGTGSRCNDLENYLNYKIYKKNDNRYRDPHGCEKSCNTTGAACIACQHPDFFHCNTTGICIHQSNVCNGHPHPECGGDDEIMDNCYQDYVKRRIVKNYATLVCDSVMYPGSTECPRKNTAVDLLY